MFSFQTIVSLLNVIKKLSDLVDEVPPIQQPQRFGNKAFKTWLTKVREVSRDMVALIESFGPVAMVT